MEIINNIKVNTESRNMFPDRKILGVQGENEVEKLVFKLDKFFNGEARLETRKGKTLKYLVMETDIEKEEYTIELTNELLKDYSSIDLQIRIINENGTVFKSKSETFEILEGINATQEIAKNQPEWVDEVDKRLDKADTEIHELENVLRDILNSIQSGASSSMIIEEIEQMLVSYFENKTVEEVEA